MFVESVVSVGLILVTVVVEEVVATSGILSAGARDSSGDAGVEVGRVPLGVALVPDTLIVSLTS